MTVRAGIRLGDNPSNLEIMDALDSMRAGLSVAADLGSDGSDWACAVARFLNGLGPDTSDRFGHMRYERVAAVASS